MHYTLEYGGGLGDMFYQLYARGSYNVLRDLGVDDTATVHLVVHNPGAPELLAYHPKRSQMTVYWHGYWSSGDDAQERERRAMPEPGSNYFLPDKDEVIEFYPHPADQAVLDLLPDTFVVMAPGAGTPDRTIPHAVLEATYERLLRDTSGPILVVGRDYSRDGRAEPAVPAHPRILNAVNHLSVPGTAWALQKAAGLVTAHSSLNLLGWCMQKPQLLLYNQAVLDRHCHGGHYDQWMFGANRSTTIHGRFDDFDVTWVDRFIQEL